MSATPLDAFHRRILTAAGVVHAITAWYSSGYYAADEHYQVIAFAQQKLGDLSANELPWEYDARMRSAFLPGIAYGAIAGCRAWLTDEPLHIAFILRLCTALVALLVLRTFIKAVLPGIRAELHRPFVVLSYFLWFLPYQHVRFSTETCAGLLLLLGLAQVIGNAGRDRSWLVAGLCWGVCVQVRPAMIVACAGAVGWFLFASDTRGRSCMRLLTGGLVALVLGVAVDSWFYGEPMHTLWNYIYKNSLSVTKVRQLPLLDETYPWWYYFPWIAKYGIWPIGAGLLGALVWIGIRRPRSWVVWCIWPYLLLVSVIPHKELRFLFPLVDLAPFVLVLAFGDMVGTSLWSRIRSGMFRRIGLGVLVVLVVMNITGLITAGLTAAGTGRMRLAERLNGMIPSYPMTLGYALEEPWIWDARIPRFYLGAFFKDIGTYDPCSAGAAPNDAAAPALLIAPGRDESGSGCTLEAQGYRVFSVSEDYWATAVLDLYNSERHAPFALYAPEARTSPPSEP